MMDLDLLEQCRSASRNLCSTVTTNKAASDCSYLLRFIDCLQDITLSVSTVLDWPAHVDQWLFPKVKTFPLPFYVQSTM